MIMIDNDLDARLLNIPDEFVGASSTEVNARTFAEAEASLANGRGLYLHGKAGRGKTALACLLLYGECLLRQTQQRQTPTLFMHFEKTASLFSRVRAVYDRNRRGRDGETETEVIDEYCNYEWLVLDDIGVSKPTEFVVSALDCVIDYRYERRRQRRTIFTSNITLDELSQRYDDRLASRIAGMCDVIEVDGEDKRVSGRR